MPPPPDMYSLEPPLGVCARATAMASHDATQRPRPAGGIQWRRPHAPDGRSGMFVDGRPGVSFCAPPRRPPQSENGSAGARVGADSATCASAGVKTKPPPPKRDGMGRSCHCPRKNMSNKNHESQ